MEAQKKPKHEIAILSDIKILDRKLAIYAEQSLECDRVIKDARAHKELCMEKLKESMGNHTRARVKNYNLTWGSIHYKAQPEKIVPAKEAYSIRKKTLAIKKF
tara:strand:- start:139 stop:447 length:309 start_codon:yes stop_codon:yes gene_type:complete